ncbi:hypothetical protein [Sinorhizobium fredii]|uniref:hypothetical protein n=1 Tax=Rhizobium fredii TaxID=380 RepID=UPI001319C496|nr:hypothetical protein [Sinorhizobium fredii]
MAEDLLEGYYKIRIDRRWDLEDLYKFPRAYEQVYFAFFSLMPHDDEYTRSRIDQAYATFPWRGGYSAVNFYNHLKYTVPKRQRPAIKSLQYASPGWIELIAVAVTVSFLISRVVKSVCASIDAANNTYSNIHRELADRKLLRIEVEKKELELLQHNLDFVRGANLEMAELLQIPPTQIAEINRRTGSDLKTLKIFLSVFRRIRILADYQNKGKADL